MSMVSFHRTCHGALTINCDVFWAVTRLTTRDGRVEGRSATARLGWMSSGIGRNEGDDGSPTGWMHECTYD